MSERVSNRRAVENNLKRLRRFAVSICGDQNSADAIVLDVITSHRKILTPGNCPEAALISLLRAVYQNMKHGEIKSQNMSLLNPLRSELVDVYVKFQWLNYTEKTIISLSLIEKLSSEKIAQITDIPLSQINLSISQSIKFLSSAEDMKCVAG